MLSKPSASANAAIPTVLRTYIDGLKTHDVDMIAGTVADDLIFVTATTILNKEQFLAILRALYAVRWRQGGTHLGAFSLPGMKPVPATGIRVTIPEQYFFYKLDNGQITEIRPEPILGGAPRGILEQIGVIEPPI